MNATLPVSAQPISTIPVLNRWTELKEQFAQLRDDQLLQTLRTHQKNYWLPKDEEDKRIWLIEMDYERLLKVIDANMMLDILELVLTPEGLRQYPECAEKMLKVFNPLGNAARLFGGLPPSGSRVSPTAILKENENQQSPFFGKLDTLGRVKDNLTFLSEQEQKFKKLDQEIELKLQQLKALSIRI